VITTRPAVAGWQAIDAVKYSTMHAGGSTLHPASPAGTAYQVCDNIMGMYAGSVVEAGSVEAARCWSG
jgi:ABC-type dipeptide/oligopeptide/nickel transport system ATPase component